MHSTPTGYTVLIDSCQARLVSSDNPPIFQKAKLWPEKASGRVLIPWWKPERLLTD